MKKGDIVTHIKTGRKGVFLSRDDMQLSINFWVVQWNGEKERHLVSPTLLVEGQWNYNGGN